MYIYIYSHTFEYHVSIVHDEDMKQGNRINCTAEWTFFISICKKPQIENEYLCQIDSRRLHTFSMINVDRAAPTFTICMPFQSDLHSNTIYKYTYIYLNYSKKKMYKQVALKRQQAVEDAIALRLASNETGKTYETLPAGKIFGMTVTEPCVTAATTRTTTTVNPTPSKTCKFNVTFIYMYIYIKIHLHEESYHCFPWHVYI